MKTWFKSFLGIALSFMCMFSCLGYASLSDELIIKGEVNVAIPNAVYIAEIKDVTPLGATLVQSPENIDAPSTQFMSEIIFNGNGSSVSFTAKVINGTDVAHFFDILKEFPEMENILYDDVEWTVSPEQGTELPAHSEMDFHITLTYKGTGSSVPRRMLHEIFFVLDSDDLTQIVSKSVTDQFLAIINNNLDKDVTYEYEGETITVDKTATYKAVEDKMERGIWSGDYIGNLHGADGDDKALLDALFGETLSFTLGEEEVPIKVMIKKESLRRNLWTSPYLEALVLYITADPLERAEDQNGTSNVRVPVYCVVFVQNSSGEWEQYTEIMAGDARLTNYEGSWEGDRTGEGSFNTDTWVSGETYYNVAANNDLDTVVYGRYSGN